MLIKTVKKTDHDHLNTNSRTWTMVVRCDLCGFTREVTDLSKQNACLDDFSTITKCSMCFNRKV